MKHLEKPLPNYALVLFDSDLKQCLASIQNARFLLVDLQDFQR